MSVLYVSVYIKHASIINLRAKKKIHWEVESYFSKGTYIFIISSHMSRFYHHHRSASTRSWLHCTLSTCNVFFCYQQTKKCEKCPLVTSSDTAPCKKLQRCRKRRQIFTLPLKVDKRIPKKEDFINSCQNTFRMHFKSNF